MDGRAGATGTRQSALPRLPRVYVPRPGLWRRLDDACERPMTLLVAPAGAGKTLGISGWLQDSDRAGEATWVHADRTWRPERLASLLREASSGDDERPRLVVIDDAHALPASSLRELDRLLGEDPHAMRLLLAARWDLPVTRLVPELLGHFTVLRGDVLRLDEAESRTLIEAHTGTADPAVLDPLVERTQGWCAATVLAARAVGSAQDPVAAARRIGGGGASVTDRVAREVFESLSPRQRHVLLSLGAEPVVTTTTAAQLSRDRGAGDLLAELETTGLLVSRVPATPDDQASPPEGYADEATYRIHPLLSELARRTLAAGGAEVERARESVVDAVRLDRSRGDTRFALSRLIAVGALDACAELLAEEGVTLTAQGRADRIGDLARLHPDTVDQHPETWFTLAINRWFAGDIPQATHWMDRMLRSDQLAERPSQLAALRLMRARLGLEPMFAAVGNAKRVVLAEDRERAGSELPLLLTELAITQNWLGELGEAEVHLTAAIWLCRTRDLPALEAAALSHLAITRFMAGHEQSCIELATEALARLEAMPYWRARHTPARARLALDLARLCEAPAVLDHAWLAALDPPEKLLGPSAPIHPADLCSKFWTRELVVRLALARSALIDAERALESHLDLPPLPDHLQVVVLLERAFLAHLSADAHVLRESADRLLEVGALGEAALVEGLVHDLGGDRKGAAAEFVRAAADTTYSQPATRPLALACSAQLLDALGRTEEALEHLREAAVATEVRRNAVPFMGWCRLGTPIRALLGALVRSTPTPWSVELDEAATQRPDYVTMIAASTPTGRERSTPTETTVRPPLSPREREVLNELARGSTYADIAAALFVSENTVKTHVSSLYGKLAVGRRSEALTVARNLRLI